MEAILDSADAYRSPVLFLLKVLSRQELPVKRLVIDELGIADIIVPDPDLFRRYLAALTELRNDQILWMVPGGWGARDAPSRG